MAQSVLFDEQCEIFMIADVLQVGTLQKGSTQKGKPYQKRQVVLEEPDSGATLNLQLWDNKSSLNVQQGTLVSVSNVLTVEYKNPQGQKFLSVNSTLTTTIKVRVMSKILCSCWILLH